MSDLSLSDEERDGILQSRVLPVVFGADRGPSADPTFTLVVGQPGAAASRATSGARRGDPRARVVSAAGLRAFHPRYADLLRSRSPRALTLLSEPAAYWTARSIAHARETGRPVLVEASVSSPAHALGLADSFARSGFSTRVVVVATPRAQSLLAATSRHLLDRRAGRASTPPDLARHDESWNAIRALVGGLEASPAVDRLTLFGDTGASLFDAARSDDRAFARASRALIAAHSAPMSNAAAMRWLSELRAAADYALSEESLDRPTAEALLELQTIAASEVLPQITLPTDSLARPNAAAAIAARVEGLRRAVASRAVDEAAPAITPPDVSIGISR